MPATRSSCSTCGQPLPAGLAEEFCPVCSLRGALGPADAAGSAPPEILRHVGDYELLELIARGGMGAVYRARQRSLGRAVAVKLMLAGPFADERMRQRFSAEATAAARLQHPHIVAIHEIGEHHGQPFFSMDLVEGGTLASLVRAQPLPARRAAELVRLVALAVQHAHAQGVLHRDLKPSNVLIDSFGQPRVSDFGLAKLADANLDLTLSSQTLGSPAYMPPEQAFPRAVRTPSPPSDGGEGRGEAAPGNPTLADQPPLGRSRGNETQTDLEQEDQSLVTSTSAVQEPARGRWWQRGETPAVGPASDVYSLGAILYHLLTARAPFQGESPQAILVRVRDSEPVPPRALNPDVPVDLETICLKCLEKESARRYVSAAELAEDLARFLSGQPVLARPVGPAGKAWRWSRRHPSVAALAVAVVALLSVVALGSTVAAVRIKRAEREARASLRESLLSQARAVRNSGLVGQRVESLDAIRAALTPDATPEFLLRARGEAIAALALPDLRWSPAASLSNVTMHGSAIPDAKWELFAQAREQGVVTIHRMNDARELERFETGRARTPRLIAFSADGRFVGLDTRYDLLVWDRQARLACFRTNALGAQLAFAPDSASFAVSHRDAAVDLHALPGGAWVRRVREPRESQFDLPNPPPGLAFSPNGRTLAATDPLTNRVDLIEVATGRPAIKAIQHSTRGSARGLVAAWSLDGGYLAVSDSQHQVSVWAFPSGARRYSLTDTASRVQGLAMDPTRWVLAGATEDRSVVVWDLQAGRRLFSAPCEAGALSFHPDGQRFGPGWRDGRGGWLELERVREFREWISGYTHYSQRAVDVHPARGIVAVSSAEGVRTHNLGTVFGWTTLNSDAPRAMAFDAAGEALWACDGFGLTRWPFDFSRPGELAMGPKERLTLGLGWNSISFAARAPRLAIGNDLRGMAFVLDTADFGKKVTPAFNANSSPLDRLADFMGFTNAAVLGTHPGLDAVALSPDARWLATGSQKERTVKVWEVAGARRVLEVADKGVARPLFSRDGRWLAATGDRLLLWETATWHPAPQLSLPRGKHFDGVAAFAPDGNALAVVLDLHQVHLFALPGGAPLAVLEAPNPVRLRALTFTPDGAQLLGTGEGGRVQLWNLHEVRRSLAALRLDWNAPPLAAPTNHPSVTLRLVTEKTARTPRAR